MDDRQARELLSQIKQKVDSRIQYDPVANPYAYLPYKGDCSAYARSYAQEAINSGINPADVDIGIFKLPDGRGHANTWIRINGKDYVLDNRKPSIGFQPDEYSDTYNGLAFSKSWWNK